MKRTGDPLEFKALGELELVMTRIFDAPRELVFDAWTMPELLQRGLGVHRGWTMPVCEIDLRVGGHYRYEWHRPATEAQTGAACSEAAGARMVVRGVFRKVVVPECIVATERFDDPW